MQRLKRLICVLSHPRELRLALSGLSQRLGGNTALGGLTAEETAALVAWAREVETVVEIGTLFGFTARTLARETGARVIAVDNFCWNPFGLTSVEHEAFTRRILEGSGVELVCSDAETFLANLSQRVNPAKTLVFLDGSHAYADVKREIDLCRAAGVGILCGHDYGNPSFGVTRAVDEAFSSPSARAGLCWRA